MQSPNITQKSIVISGDVTDRGNDVGFERAREFVQLLIEELRCSSQRCILVPGNHDVQESEEYFRYFFDAGSARDYCTDESKWTRNGEFIFVPDE